MRRHTGSVLPKIAVTRVPDGFRIFSEREKTKDDVTTVVIIGLFFPILAGIAILNNVNPLIFFLHVAPYLVLVIFAVMRLHVYRKRQGLFGDSHLDLSRWPIRLGDEITMKFKKHTKSPMEVTLISARIECVEQVITIRGKQEHVGRESRWRQNLDESEWSQSDGSGAWNVCIPSHEVASFAVRRLAIEWLVTVITSGRGMEKTSEFRLLVVPEVKE